MRPMQSRSTFCSSCRVALEQRHELANAGSQCIEHINGDSEPYFTSEQIAFGMRAAEVAVATYQERVAPPAPVSK